MISVYTKPAISYIELELEGFVCTSIKEVALGLTVDELVNINDETNPDHDLYF